MSSAVCHSNLRLQTNGGPETTNTEVAPLSHQASGVLFPLSCEKGTITSAQIGSCFIPFYSSIVLILHSIWHRNSSNFSETFSCPISTSYGRKCPKSTMFFTLQASHITDSFTWISLISCVSTNSSLSSAIRGLQLRYQGAPPKPPHNYLIFPLPWPFQALHCFLVFFFSSSDPIIHLSLVLWLLMYVYYN